MQPQKRPPIQPTSERHEGGGHSSTTILVWNHAEDYDGVTEAIGGGADRADPHWPDGYNEQPDHPDFRLEVRLSALDIAMHAALQ